MKIPFFILLLTLLASGINQAQETKSPNCHIFIKFEGKVGNNIDGYYYSVTNISQELVSKVSVEYQFYDINTLSIYNIRLPIDLLSLTSEIKTKGTHKIPKLEPNEVNYLILPSLLKDIKVLYDTSRSSK